MEDTGNQLENKSNKAPQLAPYQFKKGQSGNPSGRPKGILSMKEYARQMLSSMTEEERQEFIHGLPKDVIWKMAEGNFKQDSDITSGGKSINVIVPQAVANSFNINASAHEKTGDSNPK